MCINNAWNNKGNECKNECIPEKKKWMLILECVVTYVFSVWRLDLNVVACAFLEFVGLVFLVAFL